MPSDRFDRGGCRRDPDNARLLIRARDQQDVWGRRQVLECRSCGWRWTA